MKTIINVMENTVAIFFFIFLFVSMMDAKRRDRFDIIEKRIGGVETRISIVETRINSDNELAKSLQQNFEELNNSVINFKDQMCPTMHQQTGKEKQTSSPKRVELLKSSRILVSLGLNREKQWTRDQVEKLTGQVNDQTDLLKRNFSELKNELKVEKEELESNLEVINAKLDEKIQTKLNKLDEIITNNVIDITQVFLKSHTTEKLISTQQREIEALKETQAKLLNALISTKLVNYDYTCLSDWTKYSSYCYLVVHELKTFNEARAHCKRLEATVSDIENEAENTFIMRFKVRDYFYAWIGYSYEKEEGTWISERTGQHASFTNFVTGLLDGGTRENCAVNYIGSSLWVVVPCYKRYQFICKKDVQIDLKL
ncbi:CD209 antigen-like [Ruditapes philippinarum]|uniref:CD209 antigen-like n=1 Tax=Ruditapes philippinarum TaxID=129788 RepID=UPI00295BB09D|nr:CD209 antigen-like [Ruditapes philippinarum]